MNASTEIILSIGRLAARTFPPRPNGIGSLGHNKNVYRRNVLGYLIGPFSRATPGRSVNVFLTWLTDRYCGLRPVDPFSSNVTERPRLFGTLCTRERSDDGLTCKGRPAATRPRCRPSLLPFPEAIRTAQGPRTSVHRRSPVLRNWHRVATAGMEALWAPPRAAARACSGRRNLGREALARADDLRHGDQRRAQEDDPGICE